VDATEQPVQVTAGPLILDGALGIPVDARGIVIFAHGSGSGRTSPRNQYVAKVLRQAGLATLLMDLLTPEEDKVDQVTAQLRFDIPRLAGRVVAAVDWAGADPRCRALPIGLFGASTGAAAALIAAADRPRHVRAVVSRGGRPDLAVTALTRVQAPTLLIVGEYDTDVVAWNREALPLLAGPRELAIVPNATHLFEEPGTMEEVARKAADWFLQHLRA
jgi:putative phosphoribosyl transferase